MWRLNMGSPSRVRIQLPVAHLCRSLRVPPYSRVTATHVDSPVQVLDGGLTASLPPHVAAATGIDAMVHTLRLIPLNLK